MKNTSIIFQKPCIVNVKEEELNADLEDNEVLIRTHKSLISTGTELTILQADYPEDTVFEKLFQFPFRPGYANVGEVMEVGRNVKNIKIGDRVASETPHAKFVKYDAEKCHIIPDGISDDCACFFVIAEIVMAGVRRAKIEMGQAVVIYGLGLLGQLAGMFCRICGAFPLIGMDISAMRLKRAHESGFDYSINSQSNNAVDHLFSITGGRMADCVFEVTGNGALIESELNLLHKQGKLILMSSPRKPTTLNFHDYVNYPSISIIGAHNASHPPVATLDNPWTISRDVEFFFALMAAERLGVSHLITSVFAEKDAPAAYELLLDDKANQLGVLLDWN